MKKLIYTIAITLTAFSATAQKLGHINTQELLVSLPAYEQAKTELEVFAKEKQEEFMILRDMYQKKENKYIQLEQKCQADPTNCDKNLLQMEYTKVEESAELLQQRQYEMEAEIQEREGYLINKVVTTIKTAAEAVAKEKGITYVLDYSTLIYAGGEDLNAAVKAKLAK